MRNSNMVIVSGVTNKDGFSEKIHSKHEEEFEIVLFSNKKYKFSKPNRIVALDGQQSFKRIMAKTTKKTETEPLLIEVTVPVEMRLSENGIKMLLAKESTRRDGRGRHIMYNDAVNNATIGYGHKVHDGPIGLDPESEMPFKGGLSEEEAMALFSKRLPEYERPVNENIEEPMLQREFDAFVLLAYNIGSGGFRDSPVTEKFNGRDKPGAIKAFNHHIRGWKRDELGRRVKHIVLPGLVNRRNEEAHLFETGEYAL